MSRTKKLVLVWATFSSVTKASKKEHVFLECVLCIHFSLCFWKDIAGVKALIDLGNEVNVMIPAYALKLGLKVDHTNVGA